MQRRHARRYYWATRGCRRRSGLPPMPSTATCARRIGSSTARAAAGGPEARRAALDAWEAELEAGSAADSSTIRWLPRWSTRRAATTCRWASWGVYMRSMRLDCKPVRIDSWDELDALHGRERRGSVGRIMAPLLGVPEAGHAGFSRSAWPSSDANFIRDVREDSRLDRIYLPGLRERSASRRR